MEDDTKNKNIDVVGMGNALMDFLVEVDDQKLIDLNLKKGGMFLVEEAKALQALASVDHKTMQTVPGGASSNAIRGLSFLGAKTIFYGAIGQDKNGAQYKNLLQNGGVDTRLFESGSVTGHALTFITPDKERTFSVHLGAALNLKSSDLRKEDIRNSKILHIEAFQLEGPTKETVFAATRLAKKHGTQISMDIADGDLIKRNRTLFKDFISNNVDILFCNEIEGNEFTETEGGDVIKKMSEYVDIAVLKLGEKGSVISKDSHIETISAFVVDTVDTTGAGDAYAAGFLYGVIKDWSIKKSGLLGSFLASKIVERVGVSFEVLNREDILNRI